MTEIRKAIIELIEPFMEKELSIWLLYKDKTSWEFEEYTKWQLLNPFNIVNNKKVLWIYDITAVLKYIYDKCEEWKWYESYQWDKFLIEIYSDDIEEDNTWAFPNKPLHLYSEQEEKDLLKLLLKLK